MALLADQRICSQLVVAQETSVTLKMYISLFSNQDQVAAQHNIWHMVKSAYACAQDTHFRCRPKHTEKKFENTSCQFNATVEYKIAQISNYFVNSFDA